MIIWQPLESTSQCMPLTLMSLSKPSNYIIITPASVGESLTLLFLPIIFLNIKNFVCHRPTFNHSWSLYIFLLRPCLYKKLSATFILSGTFVSIENMKIFILEAPFSLSKNISMTFILLRHPCLYQKYMTFILWGTLVSIENISVILIL